MLSRVFETVRERKLVDGGDHLLVAVSGGPDSVALLHALCALAPRLAFTLEVACVNHGLRPAASAEAAQVATWAAALGLSCETLEVDVRAAKAAHVSWQDAARRARLAALEAHANARGCDAIALGHTADDQAETVLFRIVRGTGLLGLAGIPYRRGLFVRPMLDVTRADVLRFLHRRRAPFFEDPSNADRRYTRARVRHEWLPLLERENPRFREALVRLAAEAAASAEVAVKEKRPSFSPRAAATIARLARRAAGTQRLQVAGGEVEIRYGTVSFRTGPPAPPLPMGPTPEIVIEGPGDYALAEPEGALSVQLRRGPGPTDPAAVAFDEEALAWPLRLRCLRPGERMWPRGGPGRRKLQDLLVDAKVPRPVRARLPALVAADDTVLFVPGLRPSEVGRPTPTTRRYLYVKVQPTLPPGTKFR